MNVSPMTGAVEQAEDNHLCKRLQPKVIYLTECSHLKDITSPVICGAVGLSPKVQRKKIESLLCSRDLPI